MRVPPQPAGYDVAKYVSAGRSDCLLTVGFDQQPPHIPRFLIQLHYQTGSDPLQWTTIARMDHNETSAQGHDVYREGLHVDVKRRSGSGVHLRLSHAPLPANRGVVIDRSVDYFRDEGDYFVDVYEERRPPGSPPRWQPDGGESPPTLICANVIEVDMSQEVPADEILSPEELTELLGDATDTPPEEIGRGAEEIEIAPPWEATIVEE